MNWFLRHRNPAIVSRQLLAIGMDVLCAWLALWLAVCLRLDDWALPEPQQRMAYFLAVALSIPIMVRMGLYRAIFRYTGFSAMLTIGRAVAMYGVLFFAYIFLLDDPASMPRSVGILQPLLFLLLVGGSRALIRGWFVHHQTGRGTHGRLLIYGAGETGIQTAAAIRHDRRYTLVGYIDHDPQKMGRSLNGVEVWPPQYLAQLVRDSAITDVLLAIPHQNQAQRNAIIQQLQGLSVHVRSVPRLSDVAAGQAVLHQFQELDIADLLGRAPVAPVPELIRRHVAGQVVLVTGAGGSIGSELCRQIVQQGVQRLILVEHGEFALYQIAQELDTLAASQPQSPEILALLGNVQDVARMRAIMHSYQPHTVYHAAAYKHVPIVEHNPVQGLANNVFGTLAVARAAWEAGVAHVVLVSTDKAVRPTNIMGASKRLAEMCLQALATSPTLPRHMPWDGGDGYTTPPYQNTVHDRHAEHKDTLVRHTDGQLAPPAQAAAATEPAITAASQPAMPPRPCFCMVRFGNVLGSSGSVVPLFRQQIEAGGPITLTHAEVTRYFMTIPEAAQLVMQAAALASGGDVFVLDMGEPVRIMQLARQMVLLSGRTLRDAQHPHGDIAIQITGLRPGEKLYEELLIGDNPQPTAHPRIMTAHENCPGWPTLYPQLQQLHQLMQAHDLAAISQLLLHLVSGYRPGPLVDHVLLQQQQKRTIVLSG